MNAELVEQLRRTQQTLEPRAKALRSAAGALKQALKLAGDDLNPTPCRCKRR